MQNKRATIIFTVRRIGNHHPHHVIHMKVSLTPFFSNLDRRFVATIGLTFVFIISLIFQSNGMDSTWFSANIMQKAVPAFDGAVFPLQKTANWAKLTAQDQAKERSGIYTYDNMPPEKLITLPAYDPKILAEDIMKLPFDKVRERNTIATYITVYMGRYTQGAAPAIEYQGSHVGVDIKAPKGTPVYNIANGIVYKVTPKEGTVIVLLPRVPDVKNPQQVRKLYAIYMHMDQILVKKNDIIKRGQQIGTVGMTGLASTYHLHFQIDNAKSGIHPYWPFTWQDVKVAGLSFFEAVDQGMGLKNGRLNTVNPLLFVKNNPIIKVKVLAQQIKNLPRSSKKNIKTQINKDNRVLKNPSLKTIKQVASINPIIIPSKLKMVAPIDKKQQMAAKKVLIPAVNPDLNISFKSQSFVLKNSLLPIKIMVSESNKPVKSLVNNLTVIVKPALSTTISPVNIIDFEQGGKVINFSAQNAGKYTITVSDGKSASSTTINVLNKIAAVSKLKLTTTSPYYHLRDQIQLSLQTLDAQGKATPAPFAGKIVLSAPHTKVSFTPSFVTKMDNAQAMIKMIPQQGDKLSVVASLGRIKSQPLILTHIPFRDLQIDNPSFKAILALYQAKIIKGYADYTFRGEQPINRAGAITILKKAFKIPSSNKNITFTDVPQDAWFASAISAIASTQAVKGYADQTFRPAQNINRAEFLKVILTLTKKSLPKVLKNPYNDVKLDTWFAPYIAYAKKYQLLANPDNNFYPAQNITRAEVASIVNKLQQK